MSEINLELIRAVIKSAIINSGTIFPFEDVIDTSMADYFSINAGRTRRYHYLMRIETLGEDARTLINIFVSHLVEMPLVLDFLECQPLGSQTFMPLHQEGLSY